MKKIAFQRLVLFPNSNVITLSYPNEEERGEEVTPGQNLQDRKNPLILHAYSKKTNYGTRK
jgi:hypothetical protein